MEFRIQPIYTQKTEVVTVTSLTLTREVGQCLGQMLIWLNLFHFVNPPVCCLGVFSSISSKSVLSTYSIYSVFIIVKVKLKSDPFVLDVSV